MPTQVPNSGYVEKIYFNTSLTKEEVHNILSGLNFANAGAPNGMLIYMPFVNADYSCNIEIDYYPTTNEYTLSYAVDGVALRIFDSTNHDLENGWNTNYFIEAYNVNSENIASSTMAQFSVEMQNDKLIQLISSTPFEEPIALNPFLKGIADAIREKKKTTELINAQNFRSEILSIKGGLIEVTELPEVGEENTVYKLLGSKASSELWIVQNGKKSNYNDIAKEQGASLSVEKVFSLPTENIKTSITTGNVAYYLYYVPNDSIYMYLENNGWTDFVAMLNMSGTTYTLKGEISNSENIPTTEDNVLYVVSKEAKADEYFIYEKLPPLAVPTSGTISNLISITPDFSGIWKFTQISGGFKEVEELPNVGNSNYTYILKKDNYEIYAKDEELGIFNFIEYARKNGGSCELVGVFDSKDQLPTSNIKVSNGETEIYFYYVKNDDLYIYGSFIAEGNVWVGMSDLMFPFGGEITDTSEITAANTLYVLKSEGVEKYYRYTYIFELNMYQFDNGKIYNFTEIAKEQGLKVNAEAVTSLPSEPIESDLSTTFYVYYVKGDNAYVYNQSSFGGWVTVSTLFEIPYNGEVSSLDEMTTDGLYVLYNDGYSYKELSKIPEGYIMPNGTLDITNNGNTDVTNYAYVNVNVSAQPVLQQKTIDPIKSSQDITPDSGYDGLSKVTIRAIPDNYIIPSGTITVDSYSGPVSFDVTNYEELNLNLSLYENEVELLGNKLTCISNKADEYTYIKIIIYDAQNDIYYDRFFYIKDAGTRIETIQDNLEIRFNSQSTHNSLKVGSSSGGSEYAVLTKNGSNNKFSMNVSEDITIYLTYE